MKCLRTYHKSIGDFSANNPKSYDVESGMVLVDLRLALLEDDEGWYHHQRERYHRRQDTGPLDINGVAVTLFL